MSLFVLDDHLSEHDVRDPLLHWATARYIRDIRPGEVVKDERILSILRTLRTPTFVTIDDWFRSRNRRDRRYCIVYLAMRGREQIYASALLRRLLRLPEFRTRAVRMGKAAHLSRDRVTWWQIGDDRQHIVRWNLPARHQTGR